MLAPGTRATRLAACLVLPWLAFTSNTAQAQLRLGTEELVQADGIDL